MCLWLCKKSESSKTACSKVGLVLPQNAVLSLCDDILAMRLHEYIDVLVLQDYGVSLRARPHTQCADIVFASRMVIGKALDDQNRGALAQSDIRQNNRLPIDRIVDWLSSRGVPIQLLDAIISIQLKTKVLVRVRGACAEFESRVRGGLTGSRFAGALARIPAEVFAQSICGCIDQYGYSVDGRRIGVAVSLLFNQQLFWGAIGSSRPSKTPCKVIVVCPTNLVVEAA